MRTFSARDGEENREHQGYDDEASVKAFLSFHPEPPVGLRHEGVVDALLEWFLLRHVPKGGIDFALDAVEQSFALVPNSMHDKLPKLEEDGTDTGRYEDWRGTRLLQTHLSTSAANKATASLDPVALGQAVPTAAVGGGAVTGSLAKPGRIAGTS
jgi:hypothetical protein